jgi:RHH-type proline utilization regulon transcriptional repressor/proline dehydrogenase/delta 1-pyrroline-5-carboxylate dehydrogenase
VSTATAPPPDAEALTRAYGHEIFGRISRHGPLLFSPEWFDERMMDLGMGDEALKVQLFRFIDTLPYLTTPEAVARHLREYAAEAGSHLPGWMRWGFRRLPDNGMIGRLVAWTARSNARRMARRFIAGTNVPEAVEAVTRLRKKSLAFTIDLLGEATITEAEADHVLKQYLDLVEGLSRQVNAQPEVPLIDRDAEGPLPRVNVSVKLSALYSQFDPIDPAGTSAAVRARLRPILRAARDRGAFVNFDMEQYAFKDATLQIFREILAEGEFHDWPDAGIAIQAYLRDSEADLEHLRDWAAKRGVGVTVRLVKGAYWDYETVIAAQQDWPVPVWTRKWETDACFERCTRLLMENHRHLRPAIGSHNVRSMAYALALAEVNGLPPGRLEFQMLYGMGGPIKQALVGMGQRVRIYTPYGQLLPGMAYLVRRLLENTSNDSFLRASFNEGAPEERLLMNPQQRSAVGGQRSAGNGQPAPSASEGPALPPFRNEPLTDFAKEAGRLAMQRALEQVKAQFGRQYPPVIDGRPSPTEGWIDSVNPSHTKEIVGRCGRSTPAQAEAAVAAAKKAFPAWRDTPPEKRAEFLRRVAERFRQRRFELAAWIVYESAKPWREADGDVAEAIDFCDYYATEYLKLAQPRHRDLPGEANELFYDPRGVAVVIAPWNFPLAILTGMTAAALVTGNTAVMKPAEQSSVVAAKLMEVFQEALFPVGVVNYLPGVGEEVGPTMTDHPDVAVIAFTGSLPVGLMINERAAKTPAGQLHIKRVVAELGGKNAIIVDSDADLDEAVRGVADSAFGYAGQKCSACSRAIVLEAIHDQFLNRLVEGTKSVAVKPAEDPGCAVPPVIDEESRQRILRYIESGKQEARLAYAGELGPLATEGSYVAPHVFADVDAKAAIAQEEIFGPVLAVIKARDLNHALEIANGTRYALTGGVYSRSPDHLADVRRRFRVGNLYINRKITGAQVDRQPFGGFALSGIGSKAGGPDYLLQFVLPRAVTENTMRRGFAPTTDQPEGT